jgi:hypothetical protein
LKSEKKNPIGMLKWQRTNADVLTRGRREREVGKEVSKKDVKTLSEFREKRGSRV